MKQSSHIISEFDSHLRDKLLRLVIPVFPVASFFFLTCHPNSSDLPTGEPLVRDSAGIVIVENAASIWLPDETWKVGNLISSIGAVDGDPEYQLYNANDAIRLSNRNIVIANSGTSELRFFDENGQFIRSVGRSGGGPGEFSQNNSLRALERLAGDTLYTWDVNSQIISVFDSSGKFVRSSRFGTGERLYLMSQNAGGGWFFDGSMLLTLYNPTENEYSQNGMLQEVVRLIRFTESGDSVGCYGDFVDHEAYIHTQSGGPTMVHVPPLSSNLTVRTGNDRAYIGNGITYEISVYGLDTRLEMIIRKEDEVRPVTDDLINWALNIELETVPEELKPVVRRNHQEMSFPAILPFYRTFEIDLEGNIWVKAYAVKSDPSNEWSIFSRDGVWLGTITLPHGFEPYEIGADYLLGVAKDELDVEYIKVYELMKP